MKRETEKLLETALNQALKMTPRHNYTYGIGRRAGNRRHYSIVIQNGEVLGWGENRHDSTPPPGYPEWSRLHSECAAWSRAKRRIRKGPWQIINIRIGKANRVKLSKPCPCCQAFLQRMGCSGAWFTTGCDAKWAYIDLTCQYK